MNEDFLQIGFESPVYGTQIVDNRVWGYLFGRKFLMQKWKKKFRVLELFDCEARLNMLKLERHIATSASIL